MVASLSHAGHLFFVLVFSQLHVQRNATQRDAMRSHQQHNTSTTHQQRNETNRSTPAKPSRPRPSGSVPGGNSLPNPKRNGCKPWPGKRNNDSRSNWRPIGPSTATRSRSTAEATGTAKTATTAAATTLSFPWPASARSPSWIRRSRPCRRKPSSWWSRPPRWPCRSWATNASKRRGSGTAGRCCRRTWPTPASTEPFRF
mmetsp:Transcript_3334/g.6791  ORF Transcript_3334/g.6791 Transcript_3334/m.6791 type:complete len:200 (-) Transcript_3334:1126-1725(-)